MGLARFAEANKRSVAMKISEEKIRKRRKRRIPIK